MGNRWLRLLFIGCMLLTATGCLQSERLQEEADADLVQHVRQVQAAVDAYGEKNDVLPVKRAVGEPESAFPSYILDFSRLEAYLSQVPPSAFERGGHFVYVLVQPEKRPTVKVMDLRVTEKVRELQTDIQTYHQEKGRWPRGAKQGPGWYAVDYQALEREAVTLPSPYHTQLSLPLVMDHRGKLYVDYRMDVMQKVETEGKQPPEQQDLRLWLAVDSPYVPAHSPPMRMKNGDPVFASR